jgi:hypothetical protein
MSLMDDFKVAFPNHNVTGFREPNYGEAYFFRGKVYHYSEDAPNPGKVLILQHCKIDWTKCDPGLLVVVQGKGITYLKDVKPGETIINICRGIWYFNCGLPKPTLDPAACLINVNMLASGSYFWSFDDLKPGFEL